MNTTQLTSITSVIVLIEKQSNSIVLTQRSLNLKSHPGEACFPGGHWHPNDKGLWITALRELNEELGIDSSRVQFIKALKRETTLNRKIIYPWLASIQVLNPLNIDKNEVEKVFLLPLKDVKNHLNYEPIVIERNGYKFKSIRYIPSTEIVWGATARIMQNLSQSSS